jgi:hypothetical protein
VIWMKGPISHCHRILPSRVWPGWEAWQTTKSRLPIKAIAAVLCVFSTSRLSQEVTDRELLFRLTPVKENSFLFWFMMHDCETNQAIVKTNIGLLAVLLATGGLKTGVFCGYHGGHERGEDTPQQFWESLRLYGEPADGGSQSVRMFSSAQIKAQQQHPPPTIGRESRPRTD